jgi:hypothetical protein
MSVNFIKEKILREKEKDFYEAAANNGELNTE